VIGAGLAALDVPRHAGAALRSFITSRCRPLGGGRLIGAVVLLGHGLGPHAASWCTMQPATLHCKEWRDADR
jgi:hypothetical protein